MLKPDGDKVMVCVALTKDIKATATEKAKDLGLSLSAYVRMILMQELRKGDQ